jgi:hypothetical protein
MSRRLCVIPLLLVAMLLSASIFAASASAAEPGLNLSGDSFASVARAQALGVKHVRRFVGWSELEPSSAGSFSPAAIGQLDDFVNAANAADQQVTFVLTGIPVWAGSNGDYLTGPTNPAQYAAFTGRLAARYQGKVANWEIWNEADEIWFWHGSDPSPALYAPLLKASYLAIKASDASAQVVAGPFTGNNFEFLQELYKQGAKGYFDAVAVHTDTGCLVNGPSVYYIDDNRRVGRYSFLGFREVHRVMAENGDGDKPINMSEFGWSAYTGMCEKGMWAGMKAAGVGEALQAQYMREAFHCMAAYPYVKTASWFGDVDYAPQEEELNRYGLIRSDGSKRPAWQTLRDQVLHGDQLTSPCGYFEPPQIKLAYPQPGTMFQEELYVQASAQAASGDMRRIAFYLDGIKLSGALASNGSLVGRIASKLPSLALGAHTFKAEATDQWGNYSSKETIVQKVDNSKLSKQKTLLSFKITKKTGKQVWRGQLTVPANSLLLPSGKILLRWQKWVPFSKQSSSRATRYHWATKYARLKSAVGPFLFEQKLPSGGKWRASATYSTSGPFSAAQKNLLLRR